MTGKRKVLKGSSISSGIVIGRARVILPGDIDFAEVAIPASGISAEVRALDSAVDETLVELRQLRESADRKTSGPIAKIFDAQLLIAGDYEFLSQVKREIARRRRNAGFVYNTLVHVTTAPLKASSETYMQQMAADIEGVAKRVLSHLSGNEKCDLKFPPNTILVGKSFTPGEVLAFRQRKAVGFLCSEGGGDSHTALIARSLMLPIMLAANAWKMVTNDSRIILDSTTGDIILNPTDEDLVEYQKKKKRLGPALITRIKRLPRFPPVTSDGKEIGVAANLSLPGPADDILVEKKIPVGLYRTEFLYLLNNTLPDEETQYENYQQIASKFSGSSVVLRTFDLGYDKLSPNGAQPNEENPALGWRGIRPMLDLVNIFKTQIRAILRASTFRNLKILLPMIADLSELEKALRLIAQVKLQLRRDGIDFDNDIPIGIMVEVPSAAMTADSLARKADFLSIGTNDLTQYTLAADRMNSRVAALYNSLHPAVLGLIARTVEAGKRHNRPVSICGELAGDPMALPLLIGLGVDQLSMNPSRIFDLCRLVKRIDSTLVGHLVQSVLASGSLAETSRKLQDFRLVLEK